MNYSYPLVRISTGVNIASVIKAEKWINCSLVIDLKY